MQSVLHSIGMPKRHLSLQMEQAQITWVMENVPGGLIAIDDKEIITFFSCPAFKELGCTPSNMLGKHISAFHQRFGAPTETSPLLEALHKGIESRRVSHRLGRYFEAVNNPLLDEQGEIQGAVCLFIDVTERVLQDRELKRLENAQMVGQLAASLSHEIRNPLAVVRGHLQFLGATEEQAALRGQYEMMIEQLDRVNIMLQDFLDLAKERLKQSAPDSLSTIIARIRPMLESEAYLAGVTLTIELEETPEFLLCADDIQQLLLNLYRNALEATPAGGEVSIKVGLSSQQQHYLKISDTGCGMTPEMLAKVGTPFMTTKPHGTGLGLLQCVNIAKSYDADFSIQSQPQQGTCVTVCFPVGGGPCPTRP